MEPFWISQFSGLSYSFLSGLHRTLISLDLQEREVVVESAVTHGELGVDGKDFDNCSQVLSSSLSITCHLTISQYDTDMISIQFDVYLGSRLFLKRANFRRRSSSLSLTSRIEPTSLRTAASPCSRSSSSRRRGREEQTLSSWPSFKCEVFQCSR